MCGGVLMVKMGKGIDGRILAVALALAMAVPATLALATSESASSTPVNALVYANSPNEKSFIERYITEDYSGYSLCTMSESEFDKLSGIGLTISKINDLTTIFAGKYTFDTMAGEPSLPMDYKLASQTSGSLGLYIVQMKGPVKNEWMKGLEAAGAEIIGYVPNYAYEVLMTSDESANIGSLGYVQWVGLYQPAYKMTTELQDLKVTISLVGCCIPKETIEFIRSQISVFDEGATSTGYIFQGLLCTRNAASTIAAIPWVNNIAPWVPNELHDEAGSQLVGGFMWYNDPDNNVATPYRTLGTHGGYVNQLGWDGTGVTVAIADTGLGSGATPSAGHNDFTSRVIGGMTYSGTSWADGHGHGTHCAGLIAADSMSGNGRTYAGYGPYYVAMGLGHHANLYGQKIFSDAGGWIGPADYGQILVDGYTGGGRIHSNSWGSPSGGAYGAADQAYDIRARDASTTLTGNQQLIITVSAGNSGSGTNTIGSPGNGKNVITIGSTQNYMPDSTSYGNTDTTGSGSNPDAVSTFSSRGWTDDSRIKPDICASGEWTLSTRSPNVATSNLYGFYTPDTRYEWCSGTSQSNPTAAGGAAAIYEWYVAKYGGAPSPAVMKALLINTAKDMGTADIPNQNEGWGRMYLPTIVDPASTFMIKDQVSEFTTSGAFNELQFAYVDVTKPLKVTLAYTDKNALSGATVSLINNLDLRLTAPLGGLYHGNAFTGGVTPAGTNPIALFDTNGDGWDDRNNVECVYIPPAQLQTGLYTMRVTAFNIGGDADNDGTNDQDYSIVIYNGIDVTSKGTINIDKLKYPREASVMVEVKDKDLNFNTAVQTTTINVRSVAEPAGESVLLTETGGDTGIFQGTVAISATNAVGTILVNALDTLTATYDDANDGTGPATVTDTAVVDGTAPAPPTGLTVQWYGMQNVELYNNTFESGVLTGWTLSGASNDWQIGTPSGINGDPTSAYGGTRVIGNDLTGVGTNLRQYENNLAASSNMITTPAINCAGSTGVTLKFMRWLGVETATYDHVFIRVSNNGATWTQVWTNPTTTITDTAWTQMSYDISAVANNQAAVYIRFEMGLTDGSVAYCGWNIDNLLVTGLQASKNHNTLNWTKSTDDGVGANDVLKYNIYRANTAVGPWTVGAYIANVTKGTQTYCDLNRGQPDGINWWYVVRAVDDVGNEDTNTVAVPEVLTAAAWANLTVVAGWNLISVPVGGPTTMPAALTDKVNGGAGLVVWTRAMWYNPATPTDPWKQYNTGWNAALNDLTAVDNIKGVWLFVTTVGDGQICVGGTGYSNPATTAILLRAGWNMVGFPSDDTTYTVAMLKAACPTVTMVEQFDGAQTYRTIAMADATAFGQGKAYWVYTSADTTWNKAW
jgi:hypothetical protein